MTTVALIGLGRMGARIADAALAEGFSIVAALDRDAAPWAVTQSPALAAVATTDAERFWRVAADVTVIATHAPSHVPLLLEALARGRRRLLVEKPLAVGLSEAEEALAAVRRCGARVAVHHGRRWCTNYARLRALDGSDALGALRSIVITRGGGALANLGTHFIDLANMIFDATPESLAARLTEPSTADSRGARYHDPGGMAWLLYRDARRAYLDCGDDVGIPNRSEFVFEKGRVIVEDESRPWRVLGRREADRDLPLTARLAPLEETALDGFKKQGMAEWCRAALREIAGDGPLHGDIAHGVETIRVYAAIRWAAVTGGFVDLRLPVEAAMRRFAVT